MVHKKKISLLSLFLLAAVNIACLILVLPQNISNPNLWNDECGSFWPSKGIAYFAPPLTPEGNVLNTVRLHRAVNFDPCGFSVLLHYWSAINASPSFLRLLPFLFLITSALSAAGIAYLLTRSIFLCFASPLLIFAFPDILYYGFELRAYSMDYCGILLTTLMLIAAAKKPSKKFFFLAGLSAAFFLTGKYSFFFYMAACSSILFCGYLLNGCKKSGAVRLMMFSVPVIISMSLIYITSLKAHIFLVQSPPGYISGSILQGKDLSQVFNLIKLNFFSKEGFPIFLYLICFSVIALFSIKKSSLKTAPVFFLILLIELITVTASCFGKYCWNIQTRWNLYLQALSIISVIALIAEIRVLLSRRGLFDKNKKSAPALTALIIMFFSLYCVKEAYSFKYIPEDSTYDILSSLDGKTLAESRFFVPWPGSPQVRYHFEYGPFKKHTGFYPGNFVFGSRELFFSDSPIGLIDMDIDFIIFPYTNRKQIREFRERVCVTMQEITGYPPSRIFRVIKQQDRSKKSF